MTTNLNEKAGIVTGNERDNLARMDELFTNAAGVEDVTRRTENTKHFKLGANRFQAVVYPEPVHFRVSDQDAWEEIDNTLEEATDAKGCAVLRNRANRVRMEFPVEVDKGSMAAIHADGRTFEWGFEQAPLTVRAAIQTGAELRQERLVQAAQKMPEYAGRTVGSLKAADLSAEIETEQDRRTDIAKLYSANTYHNVLPGVSVRYTLNGEKMKEDIMLAEAGAKDRVALRLPRQYAYHVTDDQELLVLDNDTPVFMMERPIVYDADGNETVARIILTDCGDYTRLAYEIDKAFLSGAVYPVTIDPVVKSSNAMRNIDDTTLIDGAASGYPDETFMKVGKYNSKDCVALLKFKQLARLTTSDTIVAARLDITPKSSSSSKYIGAFEIKKAWDLSATWSSFDPNNSSSISTTALDCVPGASSGKISFDVTNLYRKWCTKNSDGTTNNKGIAFRTPANISGANYSELYSANITTTSKQPVMYVNYVSHAGTEGWWTYEQMSAGRAGTVYTDLFNGNMVLAHSDTVMTGNRNPVSISHYYNSCRSDKNDYNCGYGWKTSAHQKVTAREHGSDNYFVWEDGDGTEHFFKAPSSAPYNGTYDDCEGLGLKLTYDTDDDGRYILIKDKSDNQMRFKVIQDQLAWLVWSKDACGNKATYSYVSGYETAGRLNKITDPANRVTQFTYNSNGLISNIRIPAASASAYRYVYFTYDSGKRLTGVRYSELGGSDPHTTYAYDGSTKMLTSARNYDGLKVKVGYENKSIFDSSVIINGSVDQMRRVLTMEKVATDSAGAETMAGEKLSFNYKNMCTEVTIVKNTSSNTGKKICYQFNDAGNVVSVRDELGYGKFTKFSSTVENQPTYDSRLRRAVMNLIIRPDDLSNSAWTRKSSATVDADKTCLGITAIKLAASSESRCGQAITLKAGTVYTFSAYVKTSGITGTGAYLRLRKKSDATVEAISRKVTGTTAAAIGNDMPSDGWERVFMTYNHSAASDEVYYADMVSVATAGTAWFACPQIETGSVINSFSMVTDGDFQHSKKVDAQVLPVYWTKATNTLNTATTGVKARSTDSTFPSALSGNFIKIEGRPDKDKVGFTQQYAITGKKNDVFTLGGWAKGYSIPFKNDKGHFSLLLRFKKTDNSWGAYQDYQFNEEWAGWQFACFPALAPHDYKAVELVLSYIQNCNSGCFTNIFLYREAFGASFTYDDKKNIVAASNYANQKSNAVYDSADNITKYTQPGLDSSVANNQYWAYYGNTSAQRKKHLPLRTRTPMHMTDYYTYDSNGNCTKSDRVDYAVYTDNPNQTGNASTEGYTRIHTETTYAANGNYVASMKDARGKTVQQSVNAYNGTLTSVTDPASQTVSYTYDGSKRVTNVETTASSKTYRNAYTYENDRVKTVSHNTTSNTGTDVTYTFGYDALGRKKTVKVGTQTLSTNTYSSDRRGLLTKVTYGNGGKVQYTYDAFDRMTGVKYDSETTDRYKYEYGANGAVALVKDSNLSRTTLTAYDLADRPVQTELKTTSGTTLYRTKLSYDKQNRLKQYYDVVGGSAHKSDFTYDRDNRVTGVAYSAASKVNYTYDVLGRITKRVVTSASGDSDPGKLTSNYTYFASGCTDTGYDSKCTTPLVKKIAQEKITFEYTYDSRGNISSEKRGSKTTGYTYDKLGQLTRVNDPNDTTSGSTGTTWVYAYDRGGNITSKKRYAYTTGSLTDVTPDATVTYTYGDSNWKDKLTKYGSKTLAYDAIGNPTSDGTWTYEWQAGRQLKSMSKSGTGVTYKYDHNGLRVQKVVTSGTKVTTTAYTLNGSRVVYAKVTEKTDGTTTATNTMYFYYGAQGRPAKVNFNGTMYTYIHNLQGDIVGMLDRSGALVVEYKYDAWGKLLSTTGTLKTTLGKLNPFRYRGYVYDTETGLYYLRSRYYNPSWGRFVNADSILIPIDWRTRLNMFSYVNNNPVLNCDYNGTWSTDALSIFSSVTTAIKRCITKIGNFMKEIKHRYNKYTVNVYREGEGTDKPGKFNMKVYTNNDGFENVHIAESLSITSLEDMNAILDVFIDSQYYSEEKYGNRDIMRAQWVAHNMAYALANSDKNSTGILSALSGSANPGQSAKELDIRSIDNILKRQMIVYALIVTARF